MIDQVPKPACENEYVRNSTTSENDWNNNENNAQQSIREIMHDVKSDMKTGTAVPIFCLGIITVEMVMGCMS